MDHGKTEEKVRKERKQVRTLVLHEDRSLEVLEAWLPPRGLRCPKCRRKGTWGIHRRNRAPVFDYQCRKCGRVFNVFTKTPLQKTARKPSELVTILFRMQE